MNDTVKRVLFILISVALFVTPGIFWGTLYTVGGDDTRLYYIFPQEMLQNYAMNFISNNSLGVTGGYGSVSFFVPLLLLISTIKTLLPHLNVQMVLYGLNMTFGFIFYYAFLGLWFEKGKETTFRFFSRIVSALFYLFSFFVLKTIDSHQLIAIYVISVFPLVMFFFMKSLQERKIYFVVLSAFLYSAFSSTILTFPWFGALVFSCIPIYIVWLRRYPKRLLFSTFIFVAVFFCLNFYWLFHQIYPMIARGGVSTLQLITSSSLKFNNIDLIQALSHLNPPIHQMGAYLRSAWTDRYNLGFNQSYGLIYIFVILLAGIMLPKGNKKLGGMYGLSVVGLLIGFMLVTPNFGDWNVNLFIFFNNYIPFFTMFRNMFDKFAVAVSFQFGFALFISLVILEKKLRSSLLQGTLLFVLTGITLWNAHTYLFSNKSLDGISGIFNEDYVALTRYVKSMNEPARFVWLPLNFSSYSVIEDEKNSGQFYYGSSPLQFLAGASDYGGFQSFTTSADPDLNFQMLGLVHEKKYDEMGKILQRMNAKYVINYHYAIPRKYYDHMNFEGAIDQQKDGMLEMLVGEKIQDFGSRYSLYRINDKYRNEKIFLTESFDAFPEAFNGLTFEKVAPSQYEISIAIPPETINVVFLEPFDPLWEVQAVDENGMEYEIPNLKRTVAYRFGNGWTISRDELRKLHPTLFQTVPAGNDMLHLRITFRAQKYTDTANTISVISWGVTIAYLVGVGGYVYIFKKRHENK